MNQRMGQSDTPSQIEVLRALAAMVSGNLSVAMPAVVISYNPTLQTVEVQPLLNRAIIGEDGDEDQEILPPIKNVPVLHPRGGGYYVALPLVAGNTVLLICADRSLDVLRSGAGILPVDQIDLRQHNLSDAIAIPGFYPMAKPIKPPPSPTDLVIGKEVAGPTITLSPTMVDINGNFTVLI